EKVASDAYLKSISRGDYEAARQTSDQARKTADAARDQYFRASRDESLFYSGDFYFSYLRSPLRTAETDADGKFVIEVPRTGSFVSRSGPTKPIGKNRKIFLAAASVPRRPTTASSEFVQYQSLQRSRYRFLNTDDR